MSETFSLPPCLRTLKASEKAFFLSLCKAGLPLAGCRAAQGAHSAFPFGNLVEKVYFI